MEETTYTRDKNLLMKWLAGIASALVIIILTGIYSEIKQFNKFMIRGELHFEYLDRTDVEHSQAIKQLFEAVKPKEIKLEDEKTH